jgi:hypothetical protein
LGRLIGADTDIVHTRLFPERTGRFNRIDASLLPPSPFVAGSVQGAVVDSTERHREFVACFAAERAVGELIQQSRELLQKINNSNST